MRGKERHLTTLSEDAQGVFNMDAVARIGTVPYLNAMPLVYPLEKNVLHSKYAFEITKAPPSRLAKLIQTAGIDVALISVVEPMKDKRQRILSGISICSHGPCLTAQLFHKGDPSEIKTLALDMESMTSNILARVILNEKYKIQPECKAVLNPNENTLNEYDAFVSIGDKTFGLLKKGMNHTDLGEAWFELTSLPVVFAVWTLAPHFKDRDIIEVLRSSCKMGLQMLDEFIPRIARTRDIPMEDLTRYFHQNLDYKLDSDEKKGIALLFEYGHKLGLLPPPRLMEYYFG
jgi:chorismate dehydratase